MQPEYIKVGVGAGWMLSTGAVAYAMGVSSFGGWAAFAGLGLLPPIAFFRIWQQPAQTMSESIREALR